jgi:hypothetical protein
LKWILPSELFESFIHGQELIVSGFSRQFKSVQIHSFVVSAVTFVCGGLGR